MSEQPKIFRTEDFKDIDTGDYTWILIRFSYSGLPEIPHVFDDRVDKRALYRAALWADNWSKEDLVWNKEWSWYFGRLIAVKFDLNYARL